jgi:hypothetical protein
LNPFGIPFSRVLPLNQDRRGPRHPTERHPEWPLLATKTEQRSKLRQRNKRSRLGNPPIITAVS